MSEFKFLNEKRIRSPNTLPKKTFGLWEIAYQLKRIADILEARWR